MAATRSNPSSAPSAADRGIPPAAAGDSSREDRTQARPTGDDLGWLRTPAPARGLPLALPADGRWEAGGDDPRLPRLYKLGDRDLLGMAAGHFFVDASARMQGFFMLRHYFGIAGVDFWFANSCNRQSGPLWAKCGAVQVPESEVEYLFPFRLGPIAEELAIRKGVPNALASLARSSARWLPWSPPRACPRIRSRSDTAQTSNSWRTSPNATATPTCSSPTARWPTSSGCTDR